MSGSHEMDVLIYVFAIVVVYLGFFSLVEFNLKPEEKE